MQVELLSKFFFSQENSFFIFIIYHRKRQNTKAKYNNLRDRIQWFKDQLNETQTHLSRQEIHELIQRLVFFQIFLVVFFSIPIFR
jgi:hypothetical protein